MKLAGVVAGSLGTVSVESDVARAASDGYGTAGYGNGAYGGSDGVSVSTDSASSVTSTTATLNGSLNDLGGASSADGYFKWRQTGADTWNATAKQTLSTTGAFSDDVKGFEDGVGYEYKTIAEASNGDSATGGTVSFTTTDDSPTVTTNSPGSVGSTSATLDGSLDDLGGASSADCYVEWRRVGASSWNTTAKQTLSSIGSFSDDVTGLEDGKEYEYRTVADASDGDSDTGSLASFTTTNDPPAVTTASPSNVTETAGTLNGSLDDLGGASSADCSFEWRRVGASSWNTAPVQTLSSTGAISHDLTGLEDGVDYEYRLVTDASDGDSDVGSTVSFTTTNAPPAVTTNSAGSVGGSSATLTGSLDGLGNASSVDCSFEWRQVGASSWNATPVQTLSSTGSFSRELTGLSGSTDYEYRAVGDASDGDADAGSIGSFTTESSNTPPAIDSYAATEAGSPNPHCEITADWSVSDTDGNLASVVVEVIDADTGTLADTATHSVSGSGASGTDKFKLKHVGGETFDVTLTVTDGGASSSETRTVTE